MRLCILRTEHQAMRLNFGDYRLRSVYTGKITDLGSLKFSYALHRSL